MQNDQIHKRGRYSAESNKKAAREALTGARTQIASGYGISSDGVKARKRHAKELGL